MSIRRERYYFQCISVLVMIGLDVYSIDDEYTSDLLDG